MNCRTTSLLCSAAMVPPPRAGVRGTSVCSRPPAETSLDRVIYDGGERHPIRDAQLGEYVAEVGVDRVRRDVEPPGHGTVRESLRDQQRHFAPCGGQALPAAGRP